ncbi:M3 peptidase [Helicosporidium sp. ATCC 50920]|nr:M3 peptidase [Helicosporidium sp. ATCC 50920]|eukprot:KDD73652.1 M3 peptidase [Helicosporidium sp. ATCC 50920]
MATLKRLDDEEAALKRQFLSNIKQGTAAFYLTLRDGELLRGVPRSTLAAMAAEAQRRHLNYSAEFPGAIHPPSPAPPFDGAAPTAEWGPWTVTFDPWIFDSMMAYCPNRRLRQLLYQSYESRASQAPWDNVPVVERMLQVRHSRARLLGSASHAELVGRMQMAGPAEASGFLDSLLPPVASAALRTMLRIVGLMVDGEARGEDVWGELSESSNLESWNTSGARLANNEVLAQRKTKFKVYAHARDQMRPFGIPPLPRIPRVNTQALAWAEETITPNMTLSLSNCLDVLAVVTPHLRSWDLAYWSRRLESSKETWSQHSRSPPEDLSHYFPLSRVLSGAFGLLHRLWGMHVTESVLDKPPVWHPDVRYFQFFNGTQLLGSFFFDPFARPNKIRIPFTQSIVSRSKARGHFPGTERAPIVVMSTSIKAPGPREPALLQFSDVKAVFHELGHVIQILVNRNNVVHLAGTTPLPLNVSEMSSAPVMAQDTTGEFDLGSEVLATKD